MSNDKVAATFGPDKGWAFPGTSRKAHYFGTDERSLCGRWSCMWMPPAAFEPETGKPSRDDCAGCRRKVDKARAAAAPDASATNRAELARLDWTACPECDQGKHGNCDGTAWDVEADALTTCPCAEAGHPPTP